MADGGVAGVQRKHRTAALRCGDRKIAQAAAEIQHPALKVRQGGEFEGIELEVPVADLLLKLPVEEGDATVRIHGWVFDSRRVDQLPVCLLPASCGSLR